MGRKSRRREHQQSGRPRRRMGGSEHARRDIRRLRRRETFGNSGTRIHVRFFAGWTSPADLDTRRDMLEEAYRTGVPMGADLPDPPEGGVGDGPRLRGLGDEGPPAARTCRRSRSSRAGPSPMVRPPSRCTTSSAPTASSRPAHRRCADNGAQVDLSDCSYSTGLGAAELSTTWSDPDFDPALRAFYYVRVLENPTCRWTTHRALARGVAPPPSDPADRQGTRLELPRLVHARGAIVHGLAPTAAEPLVHFLWRAACCSA